MLKKITLISVLVLVVCLIAGVVLIPLAIRDFLQNGDQIISQFINSTPVYSFEPGDRNTVELNFGYSEVYVEQSKDEKVYVRVEGLFADRYELIEQTRQEEGGGVLSLSIDYDTMFFNSDGSSYLLRSGLVDNASPWVIVRVPASVNVVTTASPWRIRLRDQVRFLNRRYYDEHLWNEDEDEEEIGEEEIQHPQLSLYRGRFDAMHAALESEIQKNLVKLEAGELTLTAFTDQLDAVADTHLERMKDQLFPGDSELYDKETLSILLENYIELYTSASKQLGRLRRNEDYSEDYEMQDRYNELRDAAEDARDNFLSYYLNYLADLDGMGRAEEAEPESNVIPIQPVHDASSSVPLIPEEAPPSNTEDILSAPSVYTDESRPQ